VQRTGGSTLIVSLPKAWVKRVGLNAGDEVTITPQSDGKLIIAPRANPVAQPPTFISVDDKDIGALLRETIAVYVGGGRTIEFRSKRFDSESRQNVKDVANSLIGLEIIEESADSITTKDLLDHQEMPVRRALRRLAVIVLSMLKDSLEALKSQDVELARDVTTRDPQADRLFLLVSKQFMAALNNVMIAEQLEMSIEDFFHHRQVANYLERVGDHAEKIAGGVIRLGDTSLPDDVLEALLNAGKTAYSVVDGSLGALSHKKVNEANAIIKLNEEVHRLLDIANARLVSLPAREAAAVGTIADSIDRCGEYGTNIAEVAINSAMNVQMRESAQPV